MGFFQDLKEDLSMAVDELATEGTAEQAKDAEASPQQDAQPQAESAGQEEQEQDKKEDAQAEQKAEKSDAGQGDDMDVLPSDDLAKALEDAGILQEGGEDAISPDGKQAPLFGEQMQLDLNLASVAAEAPKEKAVKETAPDPIEAAANELKNIANIVNKEETVSDVEEFEDKPIQTPEEMMEETKIEEPANVQENARPAESKPLTEADMDGDAVDESAVITKCMTVKGDVLSRGSIEIQGVVEGNVTALGKLNVSGNLKGDAKAAEVFADAAQISGQITADGTAKIGKDSVIIGNIIASSAVIAGAVKGDIDVHGPVILDSSAIVMGNIKSKSVQINNGAAIEGMCSQCYAESSPSSFFDRFAK